MRNRILLAVAAGLALAGIGGVACVRARTPEARNVVEAAAARPTARVPEPESARRTPIVGRVVDLDGVPIAGAEVELHEVTLFGPRGAEGKTGADGGFHLTPRREFPIAAIVARIDRHVIAVAPPGPDGTEHVLVGSRTAAATVRREVQVVDADGGPVAGARIDARGVGWLRDAVTGPDGTASFETPTGAAAFLVAASGRFGVATVGVDDRSPTRIVVGGQSIEGVVRSPELDAGEVRCFAFARLPHPVTGRPVRIDFGPPIDHWRAGPGVGIGDGVCERVPCDANGRFRVTAIGPGVWTLDVTRRFHSGETLGTDAVRRVRVDVAAGARDVELAPRRTFAPSSLRVRLVDAHRRPIAVERRSLGFLALTAGGQSEALLALEAQDSDPAALLPAGAPADAAPVGEFDTELRVPGFLPSRGPRTCSLPASEPVEFVLERLADIVGRVVDDVGRPVARARVCARTVEAGGATLSDERCVASDADGAFRVEVAPRSTCELSVRSAAPRLLGSELVLVDTSKGAPPTVTLVAHAATRVRVVLRDGARLRDRAELVVRAVGGAHVSRRSVTVDDVMKFSMALGDEPRWDLLGVPPGRYTLEGTWDGRPMPSRTIDLAVGATAVVALPLK